MRIKNKLFIAALFLAPLLFSLTATTNVSAYSPKDMTKKAVMQALKKCHSAGAFREEFTSIGDFTGVDSLFKDDGGIGDHLPLPSSSGGTYHSIGDDTLRCEDVIKGYSGGGGKIDNAYSLMGHSPAKTGEWLDKYGGYNPQEGSAGESGACVKFWFKHTKKKMTESTGTTTDESTDQICVDTITGGKIASTPYLKSDGGWRSTSVKVHGTAVPYDVLVIRNSHVALATGTGGTGPVYTEIDHSGKTWDAFVADIVATIPQSQLLWNENCPMDRSAASCYAHSTTYEKSETVKGDDAAAATASYHHFADSGIKSVANLYGYTGDARGRSSFVDKNYKVTDQEQVHLYMYYFETLIGAKVSCGMTSEQASGNGYEGPIKWFKAGETQVSDDCYVTNKGTDKKLNGVSGGMFQEGSVGYKELYEYFKTLSIKELEDPSGSTEDGSGEEVGEESEDSKPSCTSNAGELGWILCPIVTGASSFLQEFYENWIEPFLNININLFRTQLDDDGSLLTDASDTNQSNIYQVWTAFQAIANLAFVVVFLFVIFSQLTGIGIDNYGIKKILPKLIVCAIMINLSYIICMIAVELSNIIGFALKGFLTQTQFVPNVENIAIKVNQSTPSGELPTFGARLAVVGIIAGIAIPYALAVGWAVLIPALVLVLSVLMSLFFLFAMLGIRQALVVILVCLSPLAFVCYMLPNTKKLFDKWFSVFKAMLLAFPICSGLVYGGDLVAKILVIANQSSDGIVSSLGILFTAAIVSIAPVFMIPGLIRKGLDAMGGLGAKLSGIQARGRGLADRGIRSTNLAKDLQSRQNNLNQFRDARRARRLSGIGKDGKLNTLGKIQNKIPRTAAQRAALAAKRQRGLANVSESMNDNRLLSEEGVKAVGAGLIAKQENMAIEDEITNMKEDTNNYHMDTMAELLRKNLAENGDETRRNALISKLASNPAGIRHLLSIATKDSAGAQKMAAYMTSSGAVSQLAKKNTFAAEYLSDLQAGENGAIKDGKAVSYNDWLEAEHGTSGISNGQNVALNVNDKPEDLLSQNTDSFEKSFKYMGAELAATTARRMLDDQNISAALSSEKIGTLEKYAAPKEAAAPHVVNVDNYTHNGRGGKTAQLTTYSDGTVRDQNGQEVDLKDWTRSVKRK